MSISFLGENNKLIKFTPMSFHALIVLLLSLGEDTSALDGVIYLDKATCESYGASILGSIQTEILKKIIIKDEHVKTGYIGYYVGPHLDPPKVYDLHVKITATRPDYDYSKIGTKIKIIKPVETDMTLMFEIASFFLTCCGASRL